MNCRELKIPEKKENRNRMGDHVALPERDSGSSVAQCRICHEEEDNDLKYMESPCACSGTLKYAHRKCIQRWCNEKGDTVCEICLQKFEPGFTVTAQTADVGQLPPLIRGELHISSENQELQNLGLATTVAAAGGSPDPNFRGRSFSTCCRLVALMFTALLLILHALNLPGNGGGQYALTLFTLFLLRAGGVLLPFYIMVHAVSVIQRRQQAHGQEYDGDLQNHRNLDEDVQELYLRV